MAATLFLSLSSIEPHHRHHRHSPSKPTKTILFSPIKSSPKSLSPSLLSSLFPPPTLQTPSQTLENFFYKTQLESGSLWARVMKPEETDPVVALLSDSFADSMMLPSGYVAVLSFLVRNYLIERRSLTPHTATLIGFYKENGSENLALGGTVEVCFDRIGASVSPPTPNPPKDSPYICNMSVNKQFRRRGIGWHLLKASEQLISQMSTSREVYLHCRMIDTAPLNMYTKAGYNILKTDSIFILLTLQRRKHLMRKELTISESSPLNTVDNIVEESL